MCLYKEKQGTGKVKKSIAGAVLFHLQHKKGSSVKCVDTFRIALTKELELFIKQNIAKKVLAVCFIIILRHRNLFILIRWKAQTTV